MAKTVYRITYMDATGERQANVVADNPGQAAAFLGLTQWQSATDVVRNVEVAGVDKPHAKVESIPPTIAPPPEPGLTPDDIRKLKDLLAKTK